MNHREFQKNIINIYANKGKQWLDTLPHLIQTIAVDWGLTELQAVNNLSFNYVLAGWRDMKPIILKLGLDYKALSREAAALETFSGYGAVEVLAKREGALLLERASPGHSLKQFYHAGKQQEAIEIGCNVMEALHQAPLPKEGFPLISDWLSIIDKDWDIPSNYLVKARQLKQKLLLCHKSYVLLHGDLHHDNILLNDNKWQVIDAHGVIGPAIFETWAFIMDIEKDIPFIANRFNYDAREVLEWYFIHLILATCWNLQDNLDPSLFLELADKTYRLILEDF